MRLLKHANFEFNFIWSKACPSWKVIPQTSKTNCDYWSDTFKPLFVIETCKEFKRSHAHIYVYIYLFIYLEIYTYSYTYLHMFFWIEKLFLSQPFLILNCFILTRFKETMALEWVSTPTCWTSLCVLGVLLHREHRMAVSRRLGGWLVNGCVK